MKRNCMFWSAVFSIGCWIVEIGQPERVAVPFFGGNYILWIDGEKPMSAILLDENENFGLDSLCDQMGSE